MIDPKIIVLPRRTVPDPTPRLDAMRLLSSRSVRVALTWEDGHRVVIDAEEDAGEEAFIEKLLAAVRDGTARGERRFASLAEVKWTVLGAALRGPSRVAGAASTAGLRWA